MRTLITVFLQLKTWKHLLVHVHPQTRQRFADLMTLNVRQTWKIWMIFAKGWLISQIQSNRLKCNGMSRCERLQDVCNGSGSAVMQMTREALRGSSQPWVLQITSDFLWLSRAIKSVLPGFNCCSMRRMGMRMYMKILIQSRLKCICMFCSFVNMARRARGNNRRKISGHLWRLFGSLPLIQSH